MKTTTDAFRDRLNSLDEFTQFSLTNDTGSIAGTVTRESGGGFVVRLNGVGQRFASAEAVVAAWPDLYADSEAERAAREVRGTKVVETLAQVGLPATYEDRTAPMVSLGLEEAEYLAAAIAAIERAWPCWLAQRIRAHREINTPVT